MNWILNRIVNWIEWIVELDCQLDCRTGLSNWIVKLD